MHRESNMVRETATHDTIEGVVAEVRGTQGHDADGRESVEVSIPKLRDVFIVSDGRSLTRYL